MLLLIYLILVLLSVAFLTFMEHMLMSLVHMRQGPSKISFFGVLQPVFDGLKLFLKELLLYNFFSLSLLFFISLMKFFLSLIFCSLLFKLNLLKYGFLVIFILIGVFVYFFLMLSFFSKSKYSVLGALRLVSQTLSFDIVFIFFILSFVFIYKKFDLIFSFLIFNSLLVFILFFFLILVELNRAPFDFSEGESELVSGYNIELGGYYFVLFFLSEYLMIFFYSFLMIFYFSINYLFGLFFLLFIIWVRVCWPRFRYDLLMSVFWFVGFFVVFFEMFILMFLC